MKINFIPRRTGANKRSLHRNSPFMVSTPREILDEVDSVLESLHVFSYSDDLVDSAMAGGDNIDFNEGYRENAAVAADQPHLITRLLELPSFIPKFFLGDFSGVLFHSVQQLFKLATLGCPNLWYFTWNAAAISSVECSDFQFDFVNYEYSIAGN
jgi:hypothetical protein